MAVAALIPSTGGATNTQNYSVLGLATASQSAVQVLGKNQIFTIVVTGTAAALVGGANIAFGLSTGTTATASAANFLIPFGVPMTFDLGQAADCFQISNNSGNPVNIYILRTNVE
jgi:hypothetical protein